VKIYLPSIINVILEMKLKGKEETCWSLKTSEETQDNFARAEDKKGKKKRQRGCDH